MNLSTPVQLQPIERPPLPTTNQQMKVSFTPFDYDYYNQWARSPRHVDNQEEAAVDSGQGQSPESETSSVLTVKITPSTQQASGHDSDSKPATRDVHKDKFKDVPKSDSGSQSSTIPRITKTQCRSASLPCTDSYKLPPLALRRSTTVMGYERLLKKVPPENTVLPMNQAVFLFKGDVFVQNSDYLSEPYRLSNISDMTLNSRYYNNRTRQGQICYGGVNNTNPKAKRCVHIPKVQFIDFSEIKSYVATRNEMRSQEKPKTEPKKEKQFVPFSFQLKLNST